MTQLPLTQTTPLEQDDTGTVRVVGTRVPLDTIAHAYREGATPEQIQDSFPSLRLRDIYATIAYMLEHEAEVAAYLSERRAQAEAVRAHAEGQRDPGLGDRLRARRSNLVGS